MRLITSPRTGESRNQKPKISKEDKKLINFVISELTAIKPGWKVATDGDQNHYMTRYKRNLAEALIDAKISDYEAINKALKYFRLDNSPWLPSTGQFVEKCRPEVIHPSHVLHVKKISNGVVSSPEEKSKNIKKIIALLCAQPNHSQKERK